MVWWIVLKFKAFPGNIYFQFEFRFTYNFLNNGVHPGALQPWIFLRRRIFLGAICSCVLLDFGEAVLRSDISAEEK
jgi:hypothetical protein